MRIERILGHVSVHIPPRRAEKIVENVGEDGNNCHQPGHLDPVLETEPGTKPPNDDGQIAPTNEGESGGDNELAHDDSPGRFYTLSI